MKPALFLIAAIALLNLGEKAAAEEAQYFHHLPTPREFSAAMFGAPRQLASDLDKRPLTRKLQLKGGATESAGEDASRPAASEPEARGAAIPVHFASDSDRIEDTDRPYLDNMAVALKLPEAKGRRVVVIGHTDAKGTLEHNLTLSGRRALAVREYLISRGVSATVLIANAAGSGDPLAGKSDADPENRRVEFVAK